MKPVMDLGELELLIREGRIETHFQTIFSVRRQAVVGLEALSRGRTPGSGEEILPASLFASARAHGLELELDRACRRAAVRAFAPLHQENSHWVLFLKFHTPALVGDLVGEHSILELVRGEGIDPRNVAIEILETEIEDALALQEAVLSYRQHGFLVALDDVGAGHANLDRIASVKPDLIKADLALIRDLDHDYHRQEVFKSLVSLSEKIGGWLVAEGIERSGEAQSILDLGGDIMQGFLLARPQRSAPGSVPGSVGEGLQRVEGMAQLFKKRVLQTTSRRRAEKDERLQVLEAAKSALAVASESEVDEVLIALTRRFAIVDSLSVLDEDGVQLCDSVVAAPELPNKSAIFAPPAKGADHSMKEYVYMLREGALDPFETQPYVPLPCGKLSVTLSSFFEAPSGHRRIVVAHLRLPDAAPPPHSHTEPLTSTDGLSIQATST